MCNQFRLPKLAQIKKYLNADLNLPLVEPQIDIFEEKDIFPNQIAPVLPYQDQKLQLINKNWGYPSPVDSKPLFNARIERFYETKPSMWDESFAKQRCLILTNEFFEYSKNTYHASNGKSYYERYSFKSKQPITMIAGIYDQNNFAMVTTKPNSTMQPIHNRMPLVIEPQELRRWLFQNFTSLINRENITLQVEKIPRKK